MPNILVDLFKFFSSLWCAVILIVTLAVIIAVGTFIESYYGAEAAQTLIYYTPWFSVVLLLLAFNLIAPAINRWPWRRQHTGFLLTHLGIILILVGSLITQRFGIEGQVAITEGDSSSRMTLPHPIIEIFSPKSGEHWQLDMPIHVFPWSGRRELVFRSKKTPFEIYLLQDFPKAILEESVQESSEGAPAVHVSLVGSMAQNHGWLFLDDPEKSEMELGPAAIRFAREPMQIERASRKSKSEIASLEFIFQSGKTIKIPVQESSVSKSFELEKTGNRVTVRRLLRDAIVEKNELIDRSKEWRNPAIELTLEGKGFKENHTVFANFPDFPTVHGMKPSAAGVRIGMKMASGFDPVSASKNELRFVYEPNKPLLYQIKKGDLLTDGTVEIGKETETGWMDFKFLVDQFFEKAESKRTFTPAPLTTERSDALRVIQVELNDGTETKTIWLRQGEVQRVSLGNADWHLAYGLLTKPLGFTIVLRDFLMDTDPGTSRPASFKSEVTLKDVAKGINRDQLIQMNEPLVHRGFKVYQSAYQVTPGQPDVSIFTVARDPGIPVKYIGSIIMILGIVLLFYFKQYSTLKSSDPKMRKM